MDRHRAVGRGKAVHVRIIAPDAREHPRPHRPRLAERSARVAHRIEHPEGRAHRHDHELPGEVPPQPRPRPDREPRAHAERVHPEVHERGRGHRGQRRLPPPPEQVRTRGERARQVIHPRPQRPHPRRRCRPEGLLPSGERDSFSVRTCTGRPCDPAARKQARDPAAHEPGRRRQAEGLRGAGPGRERTIGERQDLPRHRDPHERAEDPPTPRAIPRGARSPRGAHRKRRVS
jgi:hypothetical protein